MLILLVSGFRRRASDLTPGTWRPAPDSTLSLFVLRNHANDPDDAAPPDNLAFGANLFD
jgi:hypothetical protein